MEFEKSTAIAQVPLKFAVKTGAILKPTDVYLSNPIATGCLQFRSQISCAFRRILIHRIHLVDAVKCRNSVSGDFVLPCNPQFS